MGGVVGAKARGLAGWEGIGRVRSMNDRARLCLGTGQVLEETARPPRLLDQKLQLAPGTGAFEPGQGADCARANGRHQPASCRAELDTGTLEMTGCVSLCTRSRVWVYMLTCTRVAEACLCQGLASDAHLPAGAEDRARVLRPPAAAPLVGEGALGLCVRGLPGALRQGEAGVQAGRGRPVSWAAGAGPSLRRWPSLPSAWCSELLGCFGPGPPGCRLSPGSGTAPGQRTQALHADSLLPQARPPFLGLPASHALCAASTG